MMKLLSIAALLLTAIVWSHAPMFDLPLRFVISLSAVVVATQAIRAKKNFWAAGFYAVAVVFNPFVAFLSLSGTLSLLFVLGAIVPFGVSLIVLKTQPLLSAPSITGRTHGNESL